MSNQLAILLGGAVGALARDGVDRLLGPRPAGVFPLSTFAINVSGCLLLGFLTGYMAEREAVPSWARVGLVVGLVGGYTTFATFALELNGLIRVNRLDRALLYVGASVAAGCAVLLVGIRLGRSV